MNLGDCAVRFRGGGGDVAAARRDAEHAPAVGEPVAGGAGRARQAGAPTPLLDQDFDSGTLYALRAAVQAHAGQAGWAETRSPKRA